MTLLYPIVLAMLFSFLLLPIANFLERKGFTRILTNFIVIFAAAGVANAPAMTTAWYAMRLGFVAWLVPLMFAYYPSVIGIGGITLEGVGNMISAVVGVVAFGAAFEGWAFKQASVNQRLLFALGGVLLLYPNSLLLPAGIVILVVALVLNRRMPDAPLHFPKAVKENQ